MRERGCGMWKTDRGDFIMGEREFVIAGANL